MSASVYLIRHAQSYPSTKLSESQWPLSECGRDQAERLGQLLEPLGIKRVFSSPYARCLGTISPFAERTGMEITVNEHLRERTLAKEVRPDFREIWQRSWDDFSYALPGCESSFDAQERFVQAVQAITVDGLDREDWNQEPVAVCAHGNVIGLLLNHLEPAYGRGDADRLRNPDVVRLEFKGDSLVWDRHFNLPGIDSIATDPRETPIDW